MVPEDNDILKKLKKIEKQHRKILPGDPTIDEPFEQDTLAHLQKAMDELKNSFKKHHFSGNKL